MDIKASTVSSTLVISKFSEKSLLYTVELNVQPIRCWIDLYFIDPITNAGHSSGAHKVLYGEGLLQNKRERSTRKQPALKGRSTSASVSLSPMAKLISQLQEIYRHNYFKVIQYAINNTMAPSNPEYLTQQEKCKDVFEVCKTLPGLDLKCTVHCLSEPIPALSGLADLVTSLVEQFCLPRNTLFHKILEYEAGQSRQFERYYLYYRALHHGAKSTPLTAKHAADSILPLLVEFVKSDLMPLRKVIASLDLALKEKQMSEPGGDDALINHMCYSSKSPK